MVWRYHGREEVVVASVFERSSDGGGVGSLGASLLDDVVVLSCCRFLTVLCRVRVGGEDRFGVCRGSRRAGTEMPARAVKASRRECRQA